MTGSAQKKLFNTSRESQATEMERKFEVSSTFHTPAGHLINKIRIVASLIIQELCLPERVISITF